MLVYKNSPVKELIPSDFILKNLNGKVIPKTKRPTLIIFYAHWCPHCTNPEFTDMIKTLGKHLPNKSNVDVNAFNCAHNEENEDFASNLGIRGFPSIIFFNKNGKRNEIYQRDMKSILEEMIKHS